MGLYQQLLKRRDAAAADLAKWENLIDTLRQELPAFAKQIHGKAVATMNGARARLAPADASRSTLSDVMRRRWQDPKQRKALLASARKGAAKARQAKARKARQAKA